MSRARPGRGSYVALTFALFLTACASTAGENKADDPLAVGQALSQPFRDLNLLRDDPRAVLEAARAEPYRRPASTACTALAEEIDALTESLGPDVDEDPGGKDGGVVGELARGAVSSLVKLPFRGVIRRLTGAEQQEREARRAALAGAARRAYLKGYRAAMNCPAPEKGAEPRSGQ